MQVIDRVGRLLDAFTLEQPELTLSECARTAGMNKSSAYRLLASLAELGLVERRERYWRLGPRTVTLATIRLGRLDLRQEAAVWLQRLRDEFRAAAAFSVPDGHDMVYLERLDPPDAFGVSARLGARAPVWAGGSGKAYLSHLTAELRRRVLEVEGWQLLPRGLKASIREEIERGAERGYCVDYGEFYNGIGGVAVAIRDRSDEPVAAISVIVPGEQLDVALEHRIAARLLETRADLERTLGRGGAEDAVGGHLADG